MKYAMVIVTSEEEREPPSQAEREFDGLIRWWADLRERGKVVTSVKLAPPRTASTVSWRDRAHFFALSSRLIRRVLIDAARARASLKRGAGSPHVTLDEEMLVSTEPRADVVALDDALTALAAIDERKSRVVELRFFGGLGIEETAEVLHVSPETVKRDWKLAKAWLRRELRQHARMGDESSSSS